MTSYTKEQIAAAARLVPEVSMNFPWATVRGKEPDHWRAWQPWADTEAGRSDWAVLDTAVLQWIRKYMREAEEIVRIPLEEYYVAMYNGNLAQRQQATMAAAVAIGEHMEKEEGKVDRPEFCPTCGKTIGLLEPVVKLGKGPWTCELCDGRTNKKEKTNENT